MPSLVVANAALLRLIWQRSGVDYAVNVYGLYWASSGTVDATLTTAVETAIKGSFSSLAFRGRISNQISLARIGLRDIRTAYLPEFMSSAATVAGTDSSKPIPTQVALCITLRTALAGRRYRGRTYLTGYGDGNVNSDGTVNSTTLGDSVAWVYGIRNSVASGTLPFQLAVVSRPDPSATPANAGGVNVVTSVEARDNVWDTVRKRAKPGI